MAYALRAVSSVLLLALLLAVGSLLAAVAVLAVLALAVALVLAFKAGGGWAVAAGVALAGVAAVGTFLVVRSRRRNRRGGAGVCITTEEQPLFWVEIYRVAEVLSIRSPEELRLFPDANVAAFERRTWLGLRPGVRTLHLGLPLLAGLTERELRAVIAREFCRSWGPRSLARILLRGHEAIGRVCERLGEESLVGRVAGGYRRTFVAVSFPITRRQELATDQLCADFAGNNATTAALREVDVLSKGWTFFMDGYAGPAAAAGLLPQDVSAGFASFLQEPGRRMQLAASLLESPLGRRSASHTLTLGDRLAAIEALPDDDIHDKSGPALGLMRNPDHLIRRVEESMFGGSELGDGAWEDVVPEAARVAAREDALQLAQLAHDGGLGMTLSISTLLELISFGLVDEVVRPLLAGLPTPEVGRQTAGRLVTGFLATAAIESGTASYRFSWAVPRQLVDEQGAVDDLSALVDRSLAEENNVEALELWLKAHRVAPGLELGAEPEPSKPATSTLSLVDGLADGSPESLGEDSVEGRHPMLVPDSRASA